MNRVKPGYIKHYGIDSESMYIDITPVAGTPANQFIQNKAFFTRISDFCLSNIHQTYPYAHGDWVLSNILIDGAHTNLVDWDNIGFYTPTESKLNSDLKSAFGNLHQHISVNL